MDSERACAQNSSARLSRVGVTAIGRVPWAWRRARSATMSAMNVSGSCPMPVTTGMGHAAMARARASSLKGIMSS